MLQDAMQIPAKVSVLEAGLAVGLAMLLVEKIVGWVTKLKGKNGAPPRRNCVDDPRLCAAMQNIAESGKVLSGVEKEHEHMITSLDGQTLVLDRIYQAQALQIKALDKIVEKLDNIKR